MISGDKLNKIRQILRTVAKDKEVIERLNINENELEELILYIGRVILNWRICD